MMKAQSQSKRKILVLHGDRQTGDLFVSRLASLKRKLLKPRNYDSDTHNGSSRNRGGPSATSKQNKTSGSNESGSNYQIGLEAPNGPFVWKFDPSVHVKKRNEESLTEEEKRENHLMRTWWNRNGDEYGGLTDSLEMLHNIWKNDPTFEGILGFSRGARLGHLVASLHEASNGKLFPNLRYVILASAYGHVPMPTNFPPKGGLWDEYFGDYGECQYFPLSVPSMHIMGAKDRLVPLEASRALLPSYVDPLVHEHDGGHHVPMRAADARAILQFIDSVSSKQSSSTPLNNKEDTEKAVLKPTSPDKVPATIPDEEHALMQAEECDSLAVIFPDEFKLLSATNGVTIDEYGEEKIKYTYPISYAIQLKPPPEQLEDNPDSAKLWPAKDVALKVEYTTDYPDSMPLFSLNHDMNLLEFKLRQDRGCLNAVKETAEAELGMPSAMSCIYRAREFFEEGGLASSLQNQGQGTSDTKIENEDVTMEPEIGHNEREEMILKPASQERVKACIEEGLQIASTILKRNSMNDKELTSQDEERTNSGKGGSWKYTIGLVGKPSAGESIFFAPTRRCEMHTIGTHII